MRLSVSLREGSDSRYNLRHPVPRHFNPRSREGCLLYTSVRDSFVRLIKEVVALADKMGIPLENRPGELVERNISPAGKSDSDRALFLDYPLPCSYRDYCDEYRKRVTPVSYTHLDCCGVLPGRRKIK